MECDLRAGGLLIDGGDATGQPGRRTLAADMALHSLPLLSPSFLSDSPTPTLSLLPLPSPSLAVPLSRLDPFHLHCLPSPSPTISLAFRCLGFVHPWPSHALDLHTLSLPMPEPLQHLSTSFAVHLPLFLAREHTMSYASRLSSGTSAPILPATFKMCIGIVGRLCMQGPLHFDQEGSVALQDASAYLQQLHRDVGCACAGGSNAVGSALCIALRCFPLGSNHRCR